MKKSYSTVSILIIVITCVLIIFNLKNWNRDNRVIENDIYHYYAYLPAHFIFNDVTLSKSNYYFWTLTTDDGRKVFKMSMGLSYFYAPFFFMAHITAHTLDYETNGASPPYKFFLLISTIFYLIIGLDFVRKILNHYKFTEGQIAITVLLLGMGTNLLAYASQSAPMPHVYSFCLVSIFLFYSIKWFEKPSIKNSVIIGLITGAVTLIRPTDIVIITVFILFGLTQFKDFSNRILFFINNAGKIAIITLVAICVWIPQFIYWKAATGHYIFYSYIGERFFFDNPKIFEGLFSFRKGWFIYTPIMLLAVIGIFMMKNKVRELRIPIMIFITINVYVIFSWWCWWYGGSFGQRTIIDSYGILAVPLACVVAYIHRSKLLPKILFTGVVSFLIFLNIFQTMQYENQTLHWDGMNRELYVKQFLRLKYIDDYDKYVSYPNYDDAFNGKR